MPSQKDEIIRNRRRRQDKLEAMMEEHKYEVSGEVEGQESSLQDGQTGPQHDSSLANHAEDSVSSEVEGQESSLQDGQTGPQHNSSLVYKRQQALLKQKIMEKRIKRAGKLIKSLPKPQKDGSQLRKKNKKTT
ncbi:hypothetical protein K438DRAFT_1761623 [Mycena galopus ATCC 62051]|nr:hypothetical protein K438DRAFT_1785338 [Mycena galopus ATCC 62051]KAF8194072.1 hypothetical protein K438DRAFT_1761623 [Mycena galopus ATCC 62051]